MDITPEQRGRYRRLRDASDLYRVIRKADGVGVGLVYRDVKVVVDGLGQRQLTWSWIGKVPGAPGGDPRWLKPRDLMEGAIADVIRAVEEASSENPEPVEALEFEADEDGLPTARGFHQLYRGALANLEADEPDWTARQREGCARRMAEAYCQGLVARRSRERRSG